MDVGDVSARKELRRRLQCTSFKQFLDTHFPGKFVPLPSVLQESGQVMQKGGQCLDTMGKQHPGESPGIYPCHPSSIPSQNQAFLFTKTGELRIIWDMCLELRGFSVVLHPCSKENTWIHDEQKRLRHVQTGKCLDSAASDVIVATCSEASTQHWTFSGYVNG